jgi:hypothetical protein
MISLSSSDARRLKENAYVREPKTSDSNGFTEIHKYNTIVYLTAKTTSKTYVINVHPSTQYIVHDCYMGDWFIFQMMASLVPVEPISSLSRE